VARGPIRHTTVPTAPLPPRRLPPSPPKRGPVPHPPPSRKVPPLVFEPDASLVDVIDGLLNKGVVLNADVILALANVDLIYLRLSALLCAADRVFGSDPSTRGPRSIRRRTRRSATRGSRG
jgi:hypothetical protein